MGLPENVKAVQAKLDPALHEAFAREYMKRRKSLLIAYLLCILGWHYLYLGKWTLQLAFLLTAGGLLVWGIVDLFRLPSLVAKRNEDIAWEVMSQYHPGAELMGKLPGFLA